MNNDFDGASVIKTIIAFRNGTILRFMPDRKAAANALLCFQLLPDLRRNRPVMPAAITNSGAYDVLMYHDHQMEIKDIDVEEYAYSVDRDEVITINNAMTALSDLMYEHDQLPVTGGKKSVDNIYNALRKEGAH